MDNLETFDRYVAAAITGLIANEHFADATLNADYTWVGEWAVYIARQTMEARIAVLDE